MTHGEPSRTSRQIAADPDRATPDDGGPLRRATRAVVLGGGGPVGRAWETGLAAGLMERGIDLGSADLIVGTSAGAIVGAQLALKIDLAATAADLVPKGEPAPPPSARTGMAALIGATAAATGSADPEAARAGIGRMALAAHTISEAASIRRAMFAPLAGQAWPGSFQATAVSAQTGVFKVWDAASAVPLVRAVASSSALPGVYPPITIGGERYMDGAVRSMLNADLAAGHTVVFVVSCFALAVPRGISNPHLETLNAALKSELATIRDSGAVLEVVTPSEEFLALTTGGTNMLDPGLVPDAYRAGARQSETTADRLAAIWKT
jgi:NTE family protein